MDDIERCETHQQRRQFLLNLICFATCIEGLFFFAGVRLRVLPAVQGAV